MRSSTRPSSGGRTGPAAVSLTRAGRLLPQVEEQLAVVARVRRVAEDPVDDLEARLSDLAHDHSALAHEEDLRHRLPRLRTGRARREGEEAGRKVEDPALEEQPPDVREVALAVAVVRQPMEGA